ncbi:MAG: hypothetical protein ACKVU2_06435 [Saprospiraceae bacterium]
MKKTLLYSTLIGMFALVHFSCNDEIPQTLQDEYVAIDASKLNLTFLRKNDGLPADAGIKAMLIAAHKSSPVNYTFEIMPTSTAKAGTHYTVGNTTGSIPASSSFGNLPIQILPDNINPGESWTLNIKLVSADVNLANSSIVSFKIQVSCPSTLAGKCDFVHTDYFCGGAPITGVTELKALTANTYVVDDFVFGCWVPCYGPGSGGALGSDAAVTLRIVDICSKISVTGTDQFGDSYTYTIKAVNGPALTIEWKNTYNEFGKVVLTRQDGANWPALKN